MGGGQHMGSGCRAAGRGAATSVEAPELVRIKEVNLLFTDGMHDGPVIPHGAAQADEDRPFAAAVKKGHHLRPELVQRSLRMMFKWHAPSVDLVSDDVPQNTADSGQTDSFR